MKKSYHERARAKAQALRSYFDEDDEEEAINTPIIPSSNSLDEGIDPLDAFMTGIDAQVQRQEKTRKTLKEIKEKPQILRAEEGYQQQLNRNQEQGNGFVDSDEEVYATAEKVDAANGLLDDPKVIEALAPLDHSSIEYETFRKDFYVPHPEIAQMTPQLVQAFHRQHDISVSGSGVEKLHPIHSFAHAGFDRTMLDSLSRLELTKPTPIQAQAFPIVLSGRDVIGIAKTGSGKTLAFVLPMIVHIMDQRELKRKEGPIALVLSPTRELAYQTFLQAKKLAKPYGAACASVYGGAGKWEQIQALKKGAEIVVGTPGRLIEMIKKKVTNMKRTTFLVLDEADTMFDMGFEPQLRSIVGQLRPDRQTLLFSATFRRKVEVLARDILINPARIVVGKFGQANDDIHQVAVVLQDNSAKWNWLVTRLMDFITTGKVLVFVSSKAGCDELSMNLNKQHFINACIHGDKAQHERNAALKKFRSNEISLLIATDVAARGLDIKDIRTVVNFDAPKNIETHIHRIGRTGRLGIDGVHPGTAYTLVTMSDAQFAGQLVNNMDISSQEVPDELLRLAHRDSRFFRKRASTNIGTLHSSGVSRPSGGSYTESDVYDHPTGHKNERRRREGLGYDAQGGSRDRKPQPTMLSRFVKSSAPPVIPVEPPQVVIPAVPKPTPPPTHDTKDFDISKAIAAASAISAKIARESTADAPTDSITTAKIQRSREGSRSRDRSRSRHRENRSRSRSPRSRRRHRSRSSDKRRRRYRSSSSEHSYTRHQRRRR